MKNRSILKRFPKIVPPGIFALFTLILTGSGFGQSIGFHQSNVGVNGVIYVDSHDTIYDGSDGTLFVKIPLPLGATKLQFRVTGGCITDSTLQYGSPDGLYSNGQTPYNFSGTSWAGTYQGVPVGATTGIDPALFGLFFNPDFSDTPDDSENFRSDSGTVPNPRQRDTYVPSVNQPFYIGDGYTGNNQFVTADDNFVPQGTIQTFDIPTGASYLLLGISADNRLSDNQDASNSTSAYRVHVFDDSVGAAVGTPVTASIASAVQVSWLSETTKQYQVQSTTDLGSGIWYDFGLPIQGNGLVMSVYQETASAPKRFYRVFANP
jgi:hypothetical protein